MRMPHDNDYGIQEPFLIYYIGNTSVMNISIVLQSWRRTIDHCCDNMDNVTDIKPQTLGST